MKISITGASGFVGTNFKKYYSNLKISEIDQLTQKVEDTIFKEIDCVLHLSALAHQMHAWRPRKKILRSQ